MQAERPITRKLFAVRRGILRGDAMLGLLLFVMVSVFPGHPIASLQHNTRFPGDVTQPASILDRKSTGRPRARTAEILPTANELSTLRRTILQAGLGHLWKSHHVVLADGGSAFKKIGTDPREMVVAQSEPLAAQLAILCLALATMLLILRHARFRLNEYKRKEATDHELHQMQLQLVQSEKLASIGQLAAGVAHEMNTPIGFVACNFETLEGYMTKVLALLDIYDQLAQKVESSNKEQRLQTLERIKQLKEHMRFGFILKDLEGLFDDSKEGLGRVTKIIQNLRNFSRVDQAGDVARYSVNEGITATLTVARNEIKYRAEVETKLGDVPEILCNPGQINQVFLNILVNAAQAIGGQEREGTGHITIRTFEADGGVVCEIEDDGPGIPADKLRRVFDPFFTTKPAGKGTGLGLSISHDIIVSKHKGQLLVESAEGQGAKFTLKLPLAPAKATPEKPEQVRIGAETDG